MKSPKGLICKNFRDCKKMVISDPESKTKRKVIHWHNECFHLYGLDNQKGNLEKKVQEALRNVKSQKCKKCEKMGAFVMCKEKDCSVGFHLSCVEGLGINNKCL